MCTVLFNISFVFATSCFQILSTAFRQKIYYSYSSETHCPPLDIERLLKLVIICSISINPLLTFDFPLEEDFHLVVVFKQILDVLNKDDHKMFMKTNMTPVNKQKQKLVKD
jgi:hypothetical protein